MHSRLHDLSQEKEYMEKALAEILAQESAAVVTLHAVLALVRPQQGRASTADEQLHRLICLLETQPTLRNALRSQLLGLFAERHAVLLFATSGIYPETGILSETFRRVAHKLLPEADDRAQLKNALGSILQRDDALWLENVAPESWARLFHALQFAETAKGDAANSPGLEQLMTDLLEAMRVVAHRIAAAGLEPEMLRLDPSLENHQSPFLALCEEALLLTQQIDAENIPADTVSATQRHLLVLVDQCRETIERVRRRAQQQGASFHLTFRLRRLAQHLKRLAALAEIACPPLHEDEREQRIAAFWVELAIAECRRNDLRRFWRQNTELVALRVTENAGRSGEHYITESRPEYFAMLSSAAGGGLIIALMAANKYLLAKLGLAPLAEVLAFSLNYALGFVLIHILHFTVATKQPAMTANAIAAAIGETEGSSRERKLEPLVKLVARTLRTQFAAILGNIGIAAPTAIAVGTAIWWLSGTHFVDAQSAQHMLDDINPIGSASLLYAAVAGICLFLAGLIAGYYDNLCAYNRIPERLLQLEWPRHFFGQARWQRVTTYIENNLGALAGNFFFGFLLGGASGLGMLLGLPLDIRHIAFSAAFWGYALTGLEFGITWQHAALGALGVLAIGLTNLLVSFYLAMWVALKARGVDFAQRRQLLAAILRHLWCAPREFFLPPKIALATMGNMAPANEKDAS